MNQLAENFLARFWPLLFVMAVLCAVAVSGCVMTTGPDGETLLESMVEFPEVLDPVVENVEDLGGAVFDAIKDNPAVLGEIVMQAKEKNWNGLLMCVGGLFVGVWGGLIARKRIRRKRAAQ